ncbi:sulfotransferase domain-containing protein [Thermodesulfobacteriota bacterium]
MPVNLKRLFKWSFGPNSTAFNKKKYRVYNDDVFLVSYPRSGNTWVRQMIALLKHPELDLTRDEVDAYIPDPYYNPSILSVISRPRVIKSHEPYVPEYPKVIYLFRDGRNCLVSWYDVQTKLDGYTETFDAFVKGCISGAIGPFGSWQDHVKSWVLTAHNKPILNIRYEELCDQTEQFLQKIGIFLDIAADKNKIRAVIEGSSRQVRQAFLRNIRPHQWNKGFRGGVLGGSEKWREFFSDELLELYWQYAGETMEALGYCKY